MHNSKIVIVLVVMISVIYAGTVSAGQFGAPSPSANPGNISVGVGYFFNSDKCELSSSLKDYEMRQNQLYLQVGYASEQIEFYIRGGAADFELDNAFITHSPDPGLIFTGFEEDMGDDYQVFGTIGVKGVFGIYKDIEAGIFVEGSMFDDYSDETKGLVNGSPSTQKLEINNYTELDAGVMLQKNFNKFLIYAGPYVYWTHADVEATITGGVVSLKASDDINQSVNFGGIAGIRVPLTKKLNLEIEGQLKQEFSFGGALSYSF